MERDLLQTYKRQKGREAIKSHCHFLGNISNILQGQRDICLHMPRSRAYISVGTRAIEGLPRSII
ncbi:hypothetical protein ACU8KH_01269 [Lachancea thermotolerans]